MEQKKIYLSDYELTKLDTTSKENKYRLITAESDLKINKSTKDLLQFVGDNEGSTITEITEDYVEKRTVSVKLVKDTLLNLLERNIIIAETSEQNIVQQKEIEGGLSYRNEMRALWFRKKLVEPDKYSWLFEKLGFLFSKYFVLGVLIAFSVLDIYFFHLIFFTEWRESLRYYSSFDYLFLIPFSWFAVSLHELGHAIAAKKYGIAMPKGLGIGLYYFMFMLYTDTHESWNLSRKKRAVISTAGMYWEVILLIVLIPVCLGSKSAALKDVILLTHISFLTIFNPFLKMDGYWLLTDLLGVINLHKKIRKYFKNLIRNKNEEGKQFSNPFRGYPKRIEYATVSYGILYYLFMGFFFGFFLYRAWLIASSFEVGILERLLDILRGNSQAYGNMPQEINHLIRNLAILVGAGMLILRRGYKILSFFSKE